MRREHFKCISLSRQVFSSLLHIFNHRRSNVYFCNQSYREELSCISLLFSLSLSLLFTDESMILDRVLTAIQIDEQFSQDKVTLAKDSHGSIYKHPRPSRS